MTDGVAGFVVIGGGQAGAWVAKTLRAEGFAGQIVLIGDERHFPYERPPLSKAMLKGEATRETATILTAAQAEKEKIEFWPGVSVTRIDRAMHHVICDNGRQLRYTKLFICTGSRVRRLPGHEFASPRIHTLRGSDDALRLQAALRPGGHLLVLGGGWIGLEVAATARALGAAVTLVEAAPRLCARSLPPVASAFLGGLHRRHGVNLVLGAGVTELTETDHGVRIMLADGGGITAEHALVGIGVLPNTELAEAANLEIRDGIVVDQACMTSDADIFAAGDVTRHYNTACGRHVRLESWANAQNQAIVAAKAAMGLPVIYDEIPWFWSDQYDVNLQIIGMPGDAAEIVTRATPHEGRGSWLALHKNGEIAGGISVNAPKDIRALRQVWKTGMRADPELWASGAASFGQRLANDLTTSKHFFFEKKKQKTVD